MDSKLTWKEHIKITTHKANTVLVFLRRNLKPCSLYIKSKCYLGTVRPIIGYACTVWAPHTAQDINKIEMVQKERCTIFYNKYYHSVSVSSILESLGWPTLQARRNYLKLLLTYKILKTMITIPPNNFTPVSFNTRVINHIFNACKLLVTVTIFLSFHRQLDYGTACRLILLPFMILLSLI